MCVCACACVCVCVCDQRWSEYLEQEAAKWVDKCDFLHQDDPQWGENIYRSEFNRTELNIVITGKNTIARIQSVGISYTGRGV